MGSIDDHAYIIEDAEVSALVVEPRQFSAHGASSPGACPAWGTWTHGPSDIGVDIFSPLPKTGALARLKAKTHPDDVVALLYTGGTSGRPKGVTLTNRSMVMNVLLTLSGWEWPAEIRFLCSTPIRTPAACWCRSSRAAAASTCTRASMRQFLQEVERSRINSTFLVPTMIYLLTEAQRARPSGVLARDRDLRRRADLPRA